MCAAYYTSNRAFGILLRDEMKVALYLSEVSITMRELSFIQTYSNVRHFCRFYGPDFCLCQQKIKESNGQRLKGTLVIYMTHLLKYGYIICLYCI